jgi:hypothetical protein
MAASSKLDDVLAMKRKHPRAIQHLPDVRTTKTLHENNNAASNAAFGVGLWDAD